jgi:hypothetical protein
MELEELGILLNQTTDARSKRPEITSFSPNNGTGIFTAIKKRLKWIIFIFFGVTLIFAPYLISHQKTNFIFLFLFLVLSIESIVSFIAFAQIRAIEHSAGNIKKNLLHRIQLLKSVFRSYIFLNSFLYALLIIFLEYSMYRHWDPNFRGFAGTPLIVRLILYLTFIGVQYFIKKRSFRKYYGSYLNNMITILEQAGEE